MLRIPEGAPKKGGAVPQEAGAPLGHLKKVMGPIFWARTKCSHRAWPVLTF